MNIQRSMLVAIGMSVAVLVASCVLLSRTQVSRVKLSVASESLDLGDLWVHDEHEFVLPIRNLTSRSLKIDDFVTSCSCTRGDSESIAIAAHGTAQATFLMRFDEAASEFPIQQYVPFEHLVRPVINSDPMIADEWNVHGRKRRLLAVGTRLGPIEVTKAPELLTNADEKNVLVEFPIRSFEPLAQLTLSVAGSDISPIVRSANDSGRSFHCSLFFAKDDLGIGSNQFPIIFHCVRSASESATIAVPTTLCLYVTKDIQVLPATITAGVVPPATNCTIEFLIRSRSRRPFVVSGIELEPLSDRVFQVSSFGAFDDSPRNTHRLMLTGSVDGDGHCYAVAAIQVTVDGVVETIRVPFVAYGWKGAVSG